MRRMFGRIMWGIFFIGIGIGYAGNVLDLWNFNLFFDGWWTLALIIPCLFHMVYFGFSFMNIGGLFLGIALLLSALGVLPTRYSMGLLIPALLIILGLKIIFRDVVNSEVNSIKKECKAKQPNGPVTIDAVFGQAIRTYSDEEFHGADCNAVFGGIELFMQDAIIKEDVVLTCNVVFGGIRILAPKNVQIKVLSTPVFGGVSNKAPQGSSDDPILHIDATAVFGGVDIL